MASVARTFPLGIYAILGVVGCSSSYEPARSPRVSIVQDKGGFAYVRDGVHYQHGLTGAGLEEAVRGSPRAEREAQIYSNRLGWGWGMLGFGFVGMIGGAAMLPNEHGNVVWNGRAYAGVSLISLGLAAYVTSFVLLISAGPHQFDAINIYNDELDMRLRTQFMQTSPTAGGYQLTAPPPAAPGWNPQGPPPPMLQGTPLPTVPSNPTPPPPPSGDDRQPDSEP